MQQGDGHGVIAKSRIGRGCEFMVNAKRSRERPMLPYFQRGPSAGLGVIKISNVGKGWSRQPLFTIVGVVGNDLTLKSAYVAKVGRSFAHGDTPREAVVAATEKYYASYSLV